jgi:hypothetical protein
VAGSDEERELLAALKVFTERGRGTASEGHWRRLTEMVQYIPIREPCFPADLRAAGFAE